MTEPEPPRALRMFAAAAAALAGAMLLGLTGLTLAEVVGRAFRIAVFSGVIEISNVTVLLLCFLGLSYCFAQGGNVTVDFIAGALSPRVSRTLDLLWNVVAAIFLAVMAYYVWCDGAEITAKGEVSPTLRWSPLVLYVPAVSGMLLTAATCLVLAGVAWRRDRKEERSADGIDAD
jgi:TRAP-type C4-dicarboxylate transport system permease small subunit